MTEQEFLDFLEKAYRRGREAQVSSISLQANDPAVRRVGAYIDAHSLLPVGYQEIPVETIAGMGDLLLEKGIKPSTQEALMIILAHHGCDEALRALREFAGHARGEAKFFAEMALEECEMWNEDGH